MSAQVTINPVLTTNAAGSFNVESVGFIQGMMMDDPAIRFALAGGILAGTETTPMWGGVGIYELVAGGSTGYVGTPGGPSGTLGGQVGRATALTGSKALTGFSVFNQAYGMINSPQSPVPLAGSSMSINFFRLGSGARIAVKCDAVLASLAGTDIINTAVAWDFVNQQLIPQVTSIAVSSGSYAGSTITLVLASDPGISVGDAFTIAGITGTGSFAAANGTFTAIAGTTGTTLKYTVASGLTLTIDNSSGTFTTGSALAVKVLDLNIGNSMTVTYDATTGFATWNRNGNSALILI